MRKATIALALALLLALGACTRAEKAKDLSALMPPRTEKPALGPASDDLKKLLACCDENARAMGAECCNQLQELMAAQAGGKGLGANRQMPPNMGMDQPMPPNMGGNEPAPNAAEAPSFKTGRPVTIDPAIAARWPKVKLSVGPKSGAGKELVMAVGQKAKAEGTPLEIDVLAFAPAFKMTADAIVSDGAEPANPAAKVTIREAGKPDWSGWLFAKMPDVHAYPGDAWKVTLVEGVQKAP
jgi:hypothetical protein